jgi:hypothetical protein
LSSLHRLATDFQFIPDQYRVLNKCPCKTHKVASNMTTMMMGEVQFLEFGGN